MVSNSQLQTTDKCTATPKSQESQKGSRQRTENLVEETDGVRENAIDSERMVRF